MAKCLQMRQSPKSRITKVRGAGMALGDDLSPPNVKMSLRVIHSILEFYYSPGPLHLVVFLLFFFNNIHQFQVHN